MSFLTWQSGREDEQGEDWVVHTFLVEQRLQAAVAHSSGAENRARVFAVTGNQTVLDPYKNRQLALAQDLKTLRELTADNPSQQERLDRLGPQVNASMESERTIQDERERTGAPPTASELVEDKRRMDVVRATLVEMQGEEARLLVLRIGRTQRARHLTQITVLSSAIVGIALLVISGLALLREIDHTARMRGQVKTLNVELELRELENRRVEAERKGLRYARSLIEACLDPLVTISREGKITDVNDATAKVTGTSRESLIGSDFSDFFTDPESARRGFEQAFTEGAVKDYPLTIRDGEGNLTDVLYNASVFRDEMGQVQGVFAAARDITGQKEAAEALLSLNSQLEHYRIVVEHIDGYAIYTLDTEGIITSWGAGAQKTSGITPEEVIGRHYSSFFPAADVLAGEPQQQLAEAPRTGCYAKDGWMVKPDGDRRWASGVLNAVRDESGKLTGFIRVGRDMTQYKQAEEDLRSANRALAESGERFRLLVDPVKEYAIYMLDPEGCVETWNAGAERCKGYAAAEVMGRHVSMFFLPEDAEAGLPATELGIAAREGRFETEAWRLRKDGTKFWALVTLTSLRGPDGALRGFATVTRDLTAQKQAEDALLSLNAQLERYRIFVENIDEYAIYTLDAEGMITSWGAGAQMVSGARPEEVMGRHYSMFFPPAEVLAGVPQRELAEAARTGRYVADAWMITPHGERIWSSGVLNAVRNESGKLTGFIRVARDMTKQKLLEEDLERLKADLEVCVEERTRQLESTLVELRHKNEEVEAFVYIVSHDLRAPLVNLIGFASELQASCARLKLLAEQCVLPEVQKAEFLEILNADLPSSVHFISQSSVKFERLIDALLMLSRHGRQIYRIENLDVGEVVADAVAIFHQAITEVGATVKVGYLPSVNADMTALGQVFSNLIGNSLKYRSPERPLQVEIGGQLEDGLVHYWVRDNGLGIPETSKARLFQVFQRFHPQRAQGDGMGLAIVHRIVERHGGKIWAESREGEGTTFRFSLPGNGVSSIPGSDENVIEEAVVHGSR